jgi:hypothetical protein
MEAEQRNNIRFIAQDNVIVALRNSSTKIGEVKDISKGGLSFEHTYQEDLNREPSKKGILLWTNGFWMSTVSCRVVYDIPIPTPAEYESLTIRLITRRCGIQFEALSEDQMAQLDFFLNTYTTAISGIWQWNCVLTIRCYTAPIWTSSLQEG